MFLIIGLVILLSALIFFFISNRATETPLVDATSGNAETQKYASLIESCLTKLGTEALVKIGEHGGYIDPESMGFDASLVSYEGDAVRFSPESDLVIPYWYHLEGNSCEGGVCSYDYGIPVLYRDAGGRFSVEGQVDQYVNDRLMECLEKTPFFADSLHKLEQKAGPNTTTLIVPDYVEVRLRWPLTITNTLTGDESSLSEFNAVLPVPLEDMYAHALTITAEEVNKGYFERMTMNLVVPFSGLDENKLPPTSALYFDTTNTLFWIKQEVEEDVQGMLSSYIPAMQYYESRNFDARITGDRFKNYFYTNAMLMPSREGAGEYIVDFDFLPEFWGLYFDLNCHNGALCQGESISIFDVFNLGFQRYNFLYDMSFPVLVSIKAPDALNRPEGFTLQFFLEANIRDNSHLTGNFSDAPVIQDLALGQTMLCDFDKRNGGPVTMKVKDGYTDEPVENVALLYTCGPESCTLGRTNATGELGTGVPVCFGGYYSFLRGGYLGTTLGHQAKWGEEASLEAKIYPIKRYNMTLKKKQVVPVSGQSAWELRDNPVSMKQSEYAFVEIERESITGVDTHNTLARFYANETDAVTLTLAPGNYSVRMNLFDDEPFVIPEYTLKIDTGWFGEDEEVTIDETRINDSVPVGNAEFILELTEDMLRDTTDVEFYVPSNAIYLVAENSRKIELMNRLQFNASQVQELAPYLVPQFS